MDIKLLKLRHKSIMRSCFLLEGLFAEAFFTLTKNGLIDRNGKTVKIKNKIKLKEISQ